MMNLEKQGLERLLEIMQALRGKNGCPWDKKQDHKSLQTYLIEEAYELIEAIDLGNDEEIEEELGDVLLQVVFHSQIAKEEDRFDFNSVCKKICEKMERRHPHVFSSVQVNSEEDVKRNWHKIKQEEKGDERKRHLSGLPKALPSLQLAQKIQKTAARVGFDWDKQEDVIAKINEEFEEVKEECKSGDQEKLKEELGDLLFAVVNLCRFNDIDAESALRACNQKFKKRFEHVETNVVESEKDWPDYALDELDVFWEEAKKKER